MNILRYIFIFLFSVGLTFVQKPEQGVSAQTKKTQTTKTTKKEDIKSLKKEQKQLKNQINNTDKKLSETRKSTKQ